MNIDPYIVRTIEIRSTVPDHISQHVDVVVRVDGLVEIFTMKVIDTYNGHITMEFMDPLEASAQLIPLIEMIQEDQEEEE